MKTRQFETVRNLKAVFTVKVHEMETEKNVAYTLHQAIAKATGVSIVILTRYIDDMFAGETTVINENNVRITILKVNTLIYNVSVETFDIIEK